MEERTSMSPRHTKGTTPCSTRNEATQACEIGDLLDRLADKWSSLVVELLGGGTRRFSQLLDERRRLIAELKQLGSEMLLLAEAERHGSWTPHWK
jgi:DNA-binding HxlR family transcriptional regulator